MKGQGALHNVESSKTTVPLHALPLGWDVWAEKGVTTLFPSRNLEFHPRNMARFHSALGPYNSRGLESVKSTQQEGERALAGLWDEA